MRTTPRSINLVWAKTEGTITRTPVAGVSYRMPLHQIGELGDALPDAISNNCYDGSPPLQIALYPVDEFGLVEVLRIASYDLDQRLRRFFVSVTCS